MKKRKSTPFLKIKSQSKQILLRPYKLTDFSNCRSSHKNRRSNQNRYDVPIPTPSSATYSAFKKRIERHRVQAKMKIHFIFAIFEKKSEAYVGQIDLFVINKKLRWGNLGYCIQNQFWGLGYATEACRLALEVSFKKLNFHRIEVVTEVQNKASMKVAKKIGMTHEGKRRKFFPDLGETTTGERDMVIFGANAIDWK